jgi:hypothetical protein
VEDVEAAPMDEDGKDDDFEPASDDLAAAKEESDEESSEDLVKEEDDAEVGDEPGNGDSGEVEDEIKLAVKEANNLPEGFIEWEAVSRLLRFHNGADQ